MLFCYLVQLNATQVTLVNPILILILIIIFIILLIYILKAKSLQFLIFSPKNLQKKYAPSSLSSGLFEDNKMQFFPTVITPVHEYHSASNT